MRKSFSLFFLILLLIPITYSLGVSQEYLSDDNTLRLYPGQEKIIKLTLQNEEDINLSINFSVSSNIAEVIDKREVYDLSPKTYDTEILIRVKIPENASVGEIHKVSYSAGPLQKEVSSTKIPMTLKLGNSFNVVVIENPDKPRNNIQIGLFEILEIIAIVLALLILWAISRKMSKKIIR